MNHLLLVGFCGVLLSATSVLACGGNMPPYQEYQNRNTNNQPGGTNVDGNFRARILNTDGLDGSGGRSRRNVEGSPTKGDSSDTTKTTTKEEGYRGQSNTDDDEKNQRPFPGKPRRPHEGDGPKGMSRPEQNGDEKRSSDSSYKPGKRQDGEENSSGTKDNLSSAKSEKTVTDKKYEKKNFLSMRKRRSLSDLKNKKEQTSKESSETKEKEQYKEDKSDIMKESKSQVSKDSEKYGKSKSCSETMSVEESHHEDMSKEDCKEDDKVKESSECKSDESCECSECSKKSREHHDKNSCSDKKCKKCD